MAKGNGGKLRDARPGAGKTYRGSRKRVRRITLRGNWSYEVWIFVIVILIALFVVAPRLIKRAVIETPIPTIKAH